MIMDKEISINFTMQMTDGDEDRTMGDFAIYPDRESGNIEIDLPCSNKEVLECIIASLRDCADAIEENLPTNHTLLH